MQRYYYAIVNRSNGNLLIESRNLPFFWRLYMAKEKLLEFDNKKWKICKVPIADIECLILRSK